MNKNFNQANHNSEFLKDLVNTFKEKYFDWKITAIFYIALHLLKGYGFQKGKNLGDSHMDIYYSINKYSPKCKLDVSKGFLDSYVDLYRQSRIARYNGFKNNHLFETTNKVNLVAAFKNLDIIQSFVEDNLKGYKRKYSFKV